MRRRTEAPIGTNRFLENVLHGAIQWPWKVAFLERNSLQDYRQRPLSAKVSIAELYHENTKLFPLMLGDLQATLVDELEFRRDVVRRRSSTISGSSRLELTQPWTDVLHRLHVSVEETLTYAVELRVVTSRQLGVYEPVADALELVKNLTNEDLARLNRGLELMAPNHQALSSAPLFFVVGCFSRNDVLLGARGYRRTLAEAGRLAEALIRAAASEAITLRCLYEFWDREIDGVLEVDGTEEGVVVALMPVGQQNGS